MSIPFDKRDPLLSLVGLIRLGEGLIAKRRYGLPVPSLPGQVGLLEVVAPAVSRFLAAQVFRQAGRRILVCSDQIQAREMDGGFRLWGDGA